MFEIPSLTPRLCPAAMSRWHILECALWCVLLVYGLDKVLTSSFFRLMRLSLSTSSKRKGLFDCFSSVNKKRPFAAFLRNSGQNRKNVHQFLHSYQFCLIFIRKDEVFHGLLFTIFSITGGALLRLYNDLAIFERVSYFRLKFKRNFKLPFCKVVLEVRERDLDHLDKETYAAC